jgi:hypothetical protein
MHSAIDLTEDSDPESAKRSIVRSTGSQRNPIVIDLEDSESARGSAPELPLGDVIVVDLSRTSIQRRSRAPKATTEEASVSRAENDNDSPSATVKGTSSLKRKYNSSQDTSRVDLSSDNAMGTKLPPLEPRIGSEYSARPPNGIILPPKDRSSNGVPRDYMTGLQYSRDDSPRYFGPPVPSPNRYQPPFFPPNSAPPWPMEPSYPRRYMPPHSPSMQYADKPVQPRLSEPLSSPPTRVSEMQRPQSFTPASIKSESERPSVDPAPVEHPPIDLSESAFTRVLLKYKQIVRDEHDYNVQVCTSSQIRNTPHLSRRCLTELGSHQLAMRPPSPDRHFLSRLPNVFRLL